jgi:signal transduction histidine kinase
MPGQPEFFSLPGQRDALQSFAELDGLAIGTANGIQELRGGKLGSSLAPPGASPFRTSRLLRDRDGGLWIGTHGDGLRHLHDGLIDSFTHAEGLSDDNVWSLFEDREGNIWVATSDGFDRFRAVTVSSVGVKQGLSSTLVDSVLAAHDGTVWIATNRGLNHWTQGHITVVTSGGVSQETLAEERAKALFQDDRGRLWVSKDDRIGHVDGNRLASFLGPGKVRAFAEATPTSIWAADETAGLVELIGDRIVRQVDWTTIGQKDFGTSLAADRARGGVWVGFNRGGIAYVSDGRVSAAYSAKDGLGANRVNDLQLDADGTLWVSTAGGLSRLKDGRLKTLTSKDGLPCDAVHWTIQDDTHAFWLYQPCGLVRIAADEMTAWAARSVQPQDAGPIVSPTVFDGTDGVPLQVSAGRSRPQVSKSPNGTLWFTSFDGLSVIDPRALPFNTVPPPVHVERITADQHNYDTPSHGSQDIRLPPSVRDVQIDYTALSLVAPGQIRFRYMLEGWDRTWQDVGNRRQAFYTNLPPRPYRFRVIASNNSGVWNKTGASVQFSIIPAYYQTTWFRAGVVAILLALLWTLHQLRLRQLAGEFNRGLDARVSERTRIARELHDTLLQSFHGLLFPFQAATNLLPEGPARTGFETAIDQTALAIAEGRNAVQGLRSSTVTTNDLATAIRAFGDELTGGSTNTDAAVVFVGVEGASRDLHPILRDDVYRIVIEALRNAFRHANAHRIDVDILYGDRQFRVRVRDDGQGFDRDQRVQDTSCSGHWGLPGMRERAELIGGRLEVWSQPGSGTDVDLTIPADKVYATPPDRRGWWPVRRTRSDA